jgi:hypothetical protein
MNCIRPKLLPERFSLMRFRFFLQFGLHRSKKHHVFRLWPSQTCPFGDLDLFPRRCAPYVQ